MARSGIMNYLKTDAELLAMRKLWKELGIDSPFPPFNYDEYNGTDGYKETLRKLIDDHMKHSTR